MTHFAKVENGIVTEVIVADRSFINSGAVGDPMDWVQTSYNTFGGVHYGPNGEPDGGIPLRANYAGIGFTYDKVNDVFYAPKPYPSWTIGSTDWIWKPPVPRPGENYNWDEETLTWVKNV
jgi:hypothetical protein